MSRAKVPHSVCLCFSLLLTHSCPTNTNLGNYLAGTCNLWLTYGETRRVLEGYADTDGSMTEDQHAIMGYAFLIDGGAISWSLQMPGDCFTLNNQEWVCSSNTWHERGAVVVQPPL